jgi:hypothetical protein
MGGAAGMVRLHTARLLADTGRFLREPACVVVGA